MSNAVGTNAEVRFANEYFSQKDSGVVGKIIAQAIWQAKKKMKKNFQEYCELCNQTSHPVVVLTTNGILT